MKIALAAVAAALCATPALAQERDASSSLFLEGGGPGLLYSVNYELLFDDDFGIRAGFSYQSLSASGSSGSGRVPHRHRGAGRQGTGAEESRPEQARRSALALREHRLLDVACDAVRPSR